ncbi:hypothetical protein NXS19_010110 [Fusarium pseudograminearum]|nr:hypothetical protein NXS19_010110 [Fusarium pseudograminearum]
MEAAAKTVQQLTQRILPEKPHHLSYSADWRYHVPANESRQKHPEEWDITRLQYSTLVSEADRGVLLTRSYYDMRVEPRNPSLATWASSQRAARRKSCHSVTTRTKRHLVLPQTHLRQSHQAPESANLSAH